MTDLLALAAELVDVPSVSFDEAALVDRLEDELRSVGHLDVERVGDNLVARTELDRPHRLLLAGHTDTVPENNNGTARIEGDVLYGLGAADMKGGLAVFHELAHQVPDPSLDLTFVFYAREEQPLEHSGLGELIRERPDLLVGDCAVLGEPTDGHIEAGCQGSLRFQIMLGGTRAHTARPWMGQNAIQRAAPLLAHLASYEPRRPVIDECQFIESVQAVRISGGGAGNVVPDEVVVTVHHRFAPDRTLDQARSWFLEWIDPCLDHASGDAVHETDHAPACPPSLDHPILHRLAEGCGRTAKLGWTDVARFAQLGIPATNFGAGDPTVAHTRDEHLHRDSIERTYAALYELIS